MSESKLREDMARLSKSLYDRGFSVGSAGNISAAVPDGMLITPTNSCLGFLDPERISKLDRNGNHVAGDPPSKEIFLHRAFYETRARTGAVVHLHSTYATALSCLSDIDPQDCIPPITPYVVMRVGTVKMVPYVRPGDPKAGDLIRGSERFIRGRPARQSRTCRHRQGYLLRHLRRRGVGGNGEASRCYCAECR